MSDLRDTFLSNTKKRILFVVIAFLLMYVVSYLIDPYAVYWKEYFSRPNSSIFTELLISFIFCLLISESSILINNKLNEHFPWTESPGQRLLIEGGLNLTSSLIIIMGQLLCFYLINNEPLPIIHTKLSVDETRGMIQWIVVSTFIAFMLITINTGNYLIMNWKNTAIEAAEHKLKAAKHQQLAMEAELHALKLQIDPHFVFNNLSVLSELILENQQLGYQYAENFSKVYRYLLINSKKDVISLEEELKFLTSYIFLIEHRIGKGISFLIEIDKDSKDLYLPPLTLQLLVENAIKHNKVVKNNPLKIGLYNRSKYELVLENSLIPIEGHINSSGIGLKNIEHRYSLLSDKIPEIIKDSKHFKVIIPLIVYDKGSSNNRG